MKLAKIAKTPAERHRYMLDYREWLDTGETVTAVQFATDLGPSDGGVVVDQYEIVAGTQVIVFVSGGSVNVTSEVTVSATTSTGQLKQDALTVFVRDI